MWKLWYQNLESFVGNPYFYSRSIHDRFQLKLMIHGSALIPVTMNKLNGWFEFLVFGLIVVTIFAKIYHKMYECNGWRSWPNLMRCVNNLRPKRLRCRMQDPFLFFLLGTPFIATYFCDNQTLTANYLLLSAFQLFLLNKWSKFQNWKASKAQWQAQDSRMFIEVTGESF